MPHIAQPVPNASVLRHREMILRELTGLSREGTVQGGMAARRAFETDALTAYRCLPLAVLLPTSTEETSRLLTYCNANEIKVVPRGAGTSLAGGALPTEDAVVLCLSRMASVLEIDLDNRFARVEAGITNQAISEAVAPNYFYAPDPSSQLACTIGGNIAMNSGGAHCLRYGVTTQNLMGIKMVLMSGEIVELGGTHLDAPGYDLLGLLVGSEGQLGVVTEATVRILRKAEGARPVLMGFASAEAAGACVSNIIAAGVMPVAIEFMDRPAIKVCEEFAKAGYPLDAEAMLIIEVEGSEAEIDHQLALIDNLARPYKPTTIRVSRSEAESAAIWKGRKAAFGAVGRISDYVCMDGTIPLSMLAATLAEVGRICKEAGFQVANIFHAGDGNLHPLILYNANAPGELERVERCGAQILELCVKSGGCLTGEHGVGIEKRDLMPLQFTPTDLVQQMRLKSVFDPHWLLNPSKVFPLDGRAAA
jgi:glycolate oxidase